MNKLDTSLAFGFYLKSYEDFKNFQLFTYNGKETFKDNWLFSVFNNKPDFSF